MSILYNSNFFGDVKIGNRLASKLDKILDGIPSPDVVATEVRQLINHKLENKSIPLSKFQASLKHVMVAGFLGLNNIDSKCFPMQSWLTIEHAILKYDIRKIGMYMEGNSIYTYNIYADNSLYTKFDIDCDLNPYIEYYLGLRSGKGLDFMSDNNVILLPPSKIAMYNNDRMLNKLLCAYLPTYELECPPSWAMSKEELNALARIGIERNRYMLTASVLKNIYKIFKFKDAFKQFI